MFSVFEGVISMLFGAISLFNIPSACHKISLANSKFPSACPSDKVPKPHDFAPLHYFSALCPMPTQGF
jgi:hypothetical protein